MRLTRCVVGALTIMIMVAVPAPANASDYCDAATAWACALENTGSQVDISAGETRPGSEKADARPDSGRDTPPPPPAAHAPDGVAEPAPEEAEEDCGPLGCRGDYEVVEFPEVTLADLASFRPAAPTLSGEPAGFGVVGMPTNLVGEASEQRIAGTVLDWDVTVRFVPAEFVFSHGDGTSSTSATGGASWDSLGQAQFTPTATSHVYRERGTHPVSVSVRYAASVDFGNGFWQPVEGYVTAESGGYDVRVVEVRTALVDETCREDPSGPGC